MYFWRDRPWCGSVCCWWAWYHLLWTTWHWAPAVRTRSSWNALSVRRHSALDAVGRWTAALTSSAVADVVEMPSRSSSEQTRSPRPVTRGRSSTLPTPVTRSLLLSRCKFNRCSLQQRLPLSLASHTQQLHSISVNHSPNPDPTLTLLTLTLTTLTPPLHKSAECTRLLFLSRSVAREASKVDRHKNARTKRRPKIILMCPSTCLWWTYR